MQMEEATRGATNPPPQQGYEGKKPKEQVPLEEYPESQFRHGPQTTTTHARVEQG